VLATQREPACAELVATRGDPADMPMTCLASKPQNDLRRRPIFWQFPCMLFAVDYLEFFRVSVLQLFDSVQRVSGVAQFDLQRGRAIQIRVEIRNAELS
jgi:hypothetical protein